jgi:hypothetical protein
MKDVFKMFFLCFLFVLKGYCINTPDHPVVQIWDYGSHVLGIKPTPVFLAFSDGTLIYRVDENGNIKVYYEHPSLIRKNALHIANVEKQVLDDLMNKLREDGVFDMGAKWEWGITQEKTLQIFVIKDQTFGNKAELYYHGNEAIFVENVNSLSTYYAPARPYLAEYVTVWKKALGSIERLDTEGTEFNEADKLVCPEPFWDQSRRRGQSGAGSVRGRPKANGELGEDIGVIH